MNLNIIYKVDLIVQIELKSDLLNTINNWQQYAALKDKVMRDLQVIWDRMVYWLRYIKN